MTFSEEQQLEALAQCKYVTDAAPLDLLNKFSSSCRIDKSILMRTQLGLIRKGEKFGTYVIFRGTVITETGTWLATNFQAASTEFLVVDPELNHCGPNSGLRVQGATAKIVAPGRVHQGFLRTWSHLWYGSDILNTTFFTPSSNKKLILRYVFVALPFIIGALIACSTWQTVFMLALIAILSTMAVESGSLERFLWKPTLVAEGTPLLQALSNEPPDGPIWFVGHSLGGALATLSFAAYCNRCEHLGKKINARLVTFGSPLVGDKSFVTNFEKNYKGSFLHIADSGDPVTISPPPTPKTLRQFFGSRWYKFPEILILALSIVWTWMYSVFWKGQRPYATWNTGLQPLGGTDDRISFSKHFLKSYEEHLQSVDLLILD